MSERGGRASCKQSGSFYCVFLCYIENVTRQIMSNLCSLAYSNLPNARRHNIHHVYTYCNR